MEKQIQLTEEGLVRLKSELSELLNVARPEVIEELKAAREQGDLSENADYEAARDKQAQIEEKIKELSYQIDHAVIIASTGEGKVVSLGSTVTILALDTNEEDTFTIVGSVESDPSNNRISNLSPLALALDGHKEKSIVTITGIEEPYQVKIVKVK